jgi:hypothetical protein
MPTEHIIALLIQERDTLNQAIAALQGSPKRRGRPPKNREVELPAAPRKTVKQIQRDKKQSARMKKYWAKRKKDEAKAAK